MSLVSTLGRWWLGLSIVAVIGLCVGGCGFSEEEMGAKQREIDRLSKELAAEQAQNKKAQQELEGARSTIDGLKVQLKAAGVDMDKLSKQAEEQARALEEFKKRAAQLEDIKRRFELLRSKLQDLTKFGLNVTVRKNRLVIQLPGDVLFDTGRDKLKGEGENILKQVAAVIRNDAELAKRNFQVAGHTDNQPLAGSVFKDNWGLSVMRAREVLAYLVRSEGQNGGGLDPNHWSAAGYGETDPSDTNDTKEGKAKNRRCELVVVPNMEEMLDLNALVK
jgi:chemotaxis protein MotB